MSQARNKKKFRIAGSSACPAAVDAHWSQIRRFGSTPKKGDSILSPNKDTASHLINMAFSLLDLHLYI